MLSHTSFQPQLFHSGQGWLLSLAFLVLIDLTFQILTYCSSFPYSDRVFCFPVLYGVWKIEDIFLPVFYNILKINFMWVLEVWRNSLDLSLFNIAEVDDNDRSNDNDTMDEYHVKSTRTLFVGNLEKETTMQDLQEKFKQFGDIIVSFFLTSVNPCYSCVTDVPFVIFILISWD